MTNNRIISSELNIEKLFLAVPTCVPLSKLDQRYFVFANSLPSPLNKLALDRQLFVGKGASKPITSLKDVMSLVVSMPWLFMETFPNLTEAELFDISEATTLLIMALLVQDHYLDGQLPAYPEIPLLHQHLYTAALQKFFQLFDAQSPFWSYFNHYFTEYTTALAEERRHFGQVVDYPLERAYKIGRGKMAIHKATTTALAIKAGAENHIALLENAVDLLYAAMQLGDDIQDWQDDYERKLYTLPITRAIPSEFGPRPDLTMAEINERFEKTVILETLTKQSVDWFQEAQDILSDLPCQHWNEYVNNYQTIMRAYQQSLVAKKVLKIMAS